MCRLDGFKATGSLVVDKSNPSLIHKPLQSILWSTWVSGPQRWESGFVFQMDMTITNIRRFGVLVLHPPNPENKVSGSQWTLLVGAKLHN